MSWCSHGNPWKRLPVTKAWFSNDAKKNGWETSLYCRFFLLFPNLMQVTMSYQMRGGSKKWQLTPCNILVMRDCFKHWEYRPIVLFQCIRVTEILTIILCVQKTMGDQEREGRGERENRAVQSVYFKRHSKAAPTLSTHSYTNTHTCVCIRQHWAEPLTYTRLDTR